MSAATDAGAGSHLPDDAARKAARAVAEQLRRCWNPPVTGPLKQHPNLRLHLAADGGLSAAPLILNAGSTDFDAVASSGVRAAVRCAPYKIPAEFAGRHDLWTTVTIVLDPGRY